MDEQQEYVCQDHQGKYIRCPFGVPDKLNVFVPLLARIEERIVHLNERFEGIEGKMDAIATYNRDKLDSLEIRVSRLEQDNTRSKTNWGQVTQTFMTILATVAAAYVAFKLGITP